MNVQLLYIMIRTEDILFHTLSLTILISGEKKKKQKKRKKKKREAIKATNGGMKRKN